MGFAGSLHCLGMCSPLAMAVTNMTPTVFVNRLLYNSGRILTYGAMGAVVASIGVALPIGKAQGLLSVLLGISLLVIGLSGMSVMKVPLISRAFGNFSVLLKKAFAKHLQRKNYLSILLLGSLNGVLPCGLSFLALTYCITLRAPLDGFSFMLWFGVGTLPVMLGLTTVFHWIMKRFQFDAKRVTTGMLVISGLVLIARVFIVHIPHAKSVHEGMIDIVLCR
jgi:sulfite exporter TauE/SafE